MASFNNTVREHNKGREESGMVLGLQGWRSLEFQGCAGGRRERAGRQRPRIACKGVMILAKPGSPQSRGTALRPRNTTATHSSQSLVTSNEHARGKTRLCSHNALAPGYATRVCFASSRRLPLEGSLVLTRVRPPRANCRRQRPIAAARRWRMRNPSGGQRPGGAAETNKITWASDGPNQHRRRRRGGVFTPRPSSVSPPRRRHRTS